MKALAASTNSPADEVARTQRVLDALVQEQRDLPRLIADASRGEDAAAWARLGLRRDNITHEVEQAQLAVLQARLTLAWDDAQQAVEYAATTQAALQQAGDASRQQEASRRAKPSTYSDAATAHAEQARVSDTLIHARVQDANAAQAAASALLVIDELEDSLEIASGVRPESGPGLRATPSTLTATYVLNEPRPGLNRTKPFLAGTKPPRWAAWLLSRA